MSWIKVIDYADAVGPLKRLYDRVKGPNNKVDNVLKIHSLRPHSLVGHMGLYKSVLHNSNNTLPKWYLEFLGVYVSHLNHCHYCFDHHFVGMQNCLKDDKKAGKLKQAIVGNVLITQLEGAYLAGAEYSKTLTLDPSSIKKEDIALLKESGLSDGEILEINQVSAYFNYVNRTVVGLGVDIAGDTIGLSPNESDDPNNWEHK